MHRFNRIIENNHRKNNKYNETNVMKTDSGRESMPGHEGFWWEKMSVCLSVCLDEDCITSFARGGKRISSRQHIRQL